jgi:ribosomal protein S18 acetylase RimI-like enzyme
MNSEINIVPFSDELAGHFTRLNLAWVKKYFVVEPLDEKMLGNPKHFFIDRGGHIFFAMINGEVAGTFALLNEGNDVYELAKMAVDEKFIGHGIGNRLMEFCIAKAKELGAKKIELVSNTKLGPAIHLYEKYGFVEVPLGNTEYKRGNIRMELKLN